jgi:hypothetical protein
MRRTQVWALLLAGLTVAVPIVVPLLVRGAGDLEVWAAIGVVLALGVPGVLAGVLLALSEGRWARWSALVLSLLFLLIAVATAGFLAGYLHLPTALGLIVLSVIALRHDSARAADARA